MQKGHVLQFDCQNCKSPIQFSVFELETLKGCLSCSKCEKKYIFNDPILQRQLRKFEMLCRQVVDSEEILSQTSVVGINVGNKCVKVPYKLLLTRFTSMLELNIGGDTLAIEFRLEPLRDL